MAEVLTAAGKVLEAGTGAFAAGQGAHENAVQYRQDAQVGADARRQNERLMNGPAAFPGYSENAYGQPIPQFTDGAPQGGLPPNTQLGTMPVGQPVMLSPDGQYVMPATQNMANAVMPQRGFDAGSAMGMQPMYVQQGAAPNVFGVPYFFTDTQVR